MAPLDPRELPDAVRAWLPADPTLEIPEQGTCASVALVVGAPIVVKRLRGVLDSSVAEWEYHVLRELEASGLPIPRAIGLHVREHEGEREAWLCMTRVPGEPLHLVLRDEPDPAARRGWYGAVGAIAARIHAMPIPAALRTNAPLTWFERVLRGTRRATDRVRQVVLRLDRDRPPDAPETLIHGDFTLDNVLVADGEITGVVDWGGAGGGDPRYDLTLALSSDGETALEHGAAAAFFEGYRSVPIPKELRRFVDQAYHLRDAG